MRFSIRVLLGAAAFGVASAHAVMAAGLPAKAVTYVPDYSWTGFYAGGQVGRDWNSNVITRIDTSGGVNYPPGFVDVANDGQGWLGGGYAGYNYQFGRFIVGIDGDYSRTNLAGTSTDVGVATGIAHQTADKFDTVNWIATATGRLGYAVNEWMVFGKAGWAWDGYHRDAIGYNSVGTAVSTSSTSPKTLNGWTVGAGVEWGLAAHWSAKLEYDYVKFSNATVNFTNTNISTGATTFNPASLAASLSMAKLGVAYRF